MKNNDLTKDEETILSILIRERRPMTLTELAREAKMSRQTVEKCVKELVKEELIRWEDGKAKK